MKPLHRSLLGAIVAVAAVPVFLGLQACIPVPIGDPERSSIDPELSGMWVADGGTIVMLEPWDERSWLLAAVPVDFNDGKSCGAGDAAADDGGTDVEVQEEGGVQSAAGSDAEIVIEVEDDDDAYAGLVSEMQQYGAECLSAGTVELYKVWRKKLGGRWFMTWQPMAYFDDEYGYLKTMWFGMAIEKVDSNTVLLHVVDIDAEVFDDLEALGEIAGEEPPVDPKLQRKARRELERALRRSADNEDIYDDNESMRFDRVQPEDYELFNAVVTDVLQGMDL